MELKLKLKYLGTILFLFLLMIIFDWYKNIEYSYTYDEKVKEYLSQNELEPFRKSFKIDNNATYYLNSVKTVKKTKSGIPFIFNKEVLNETKPEFMHDPSQ